MLKETAGFEKFITGCSLFKKTNQQLNKLVVLLGL